MTSGPAMDPHGGWAVLALVVGLSGCSGGGAERSSDGTGASSATMGSGGSSSTLTTTGGGTGGVVAPTDPGVPESPDACAESLPGQRLLRRLTQQELSNTHAAVFPHLASELGELPADLQGAVRLTNDASTLLMGSQMAEAVLARAEQIADATVAEPTLSAVLPCAAQADVACASQFIDDYGAKLFRRPLSDAERARYVNHFESVSGRSDFATGLKWVMVSLIQSPYSVYRSELGDSGRLTPYEVASELSYNYTASPPSPELMTMAVNGGLDDPQTRVEQAKLLLATDAGQRVVQQFFAEWLWLAQASSANRAGAPDNFPTIRSKMVLETEQFINDVVFTRQGTLSDLLTVNYTVADAELASFYGFTGGSGDLFSGTGAELQRDHGVGIFAQGSVLTSMASVEITSPTRRGLLLLKRLYCEIPGAPQAVNFDLTRGEIQGNTTRERLENSHLAAGCKACHAQFDPLGFAFEHFDHIGRYRSEEQTPNGSFPIDATVAVQKLDGQVVNGQEELMPLLAQDPEVLSCVSATLERYVYGGAGSCRAKQARSLAMQGGIALVDFLAELAREPHFVSRQ